MAFVLSVVQIGLWVILVFASAHLLRCARYAWSRPLRPDEDEPLAVPPVVTVQLPLRNEGAVAARVVRAVCALDWPRDRLEIQVIDDSDDDTPAIVDAAVADLAAKGHRVRVLRRGDRQGFKAGGLQYGLGLAEGDFIAVLDADSVPPRNFLRQLVPPLLDDPQLGFTQARWSFDDERSSLLLRVQALLLHGLMLVEQSRLSAYGSPLQFNGSGGVWRRAALDAAGGWLPGGKASLTEDLDVAYRARLAGWRGLQVPEVAVLTELPATMAAFRAQQKRWVRGAGQVLHGLGGRVSNPTMLAHLLRHGRQPYLVALTLWLPWTALDRVKPSLNAPAAWPIVLALVTLSVGAYYGSALRRLGRSALGGFVMAPVVLSLSIGLCLCLAVALLRGLAGGSAEFVRTPKRGDAPAAREHAALDKLAFIEVALGLAYAVLAVVELSTGAWTTAIVFASLFAAGYLWVGLGSVFDR